VTPQPGLVTAAREQRRTPMPIRTVPLRYRRVKIIVVIIIVTWLITTLRFGPGWLTPTDLAFFALILNPSSRRRRPALPQR